MRSIAAVSAGLVAALLTSGVRAGEFDAQGNYLRADDAAGFVGFESEPARYLPEDVDLACRVPGFTRIAEDDALEGGGYLKLDVPGGCAERLLVDVPQVPGSYQARVWMRHGSLNAQLTVLYPEESGLVTQFARLFPTGRVTSDGWVELGSNDIPIDGALATAVYLRVIDLASTAGVDLDALELTPSGSFAAQQTCAGRGDPVCGTGEDCISQRCRLGRAFVPPLPPEALRQEAVDVLLGRLEIFFGGRKTRTEDLPHALELMQAMRTAETAWEFWSVWARGIRRLHDWHTSASGAIRAVETRGRLNVCFFEGDADASHAQWPKDPRYADVLVSHSGPGGAGLKAGDRLVAVDGMHPLEWAASLIDVDWGHHLACDATVFAELAEDLGGPTWSGGSLILRYARSLSVLRCDAGTGTCDEVPETIEVATLPDDGGGPDVACDNRPFYHLQGNSPDDSTHYVFYDFFRGRIRDTTDEEAIYGMVWDTLYGGGEPQGHVNSNIASAISDWKANARGVILDHRAGNGGTLDAPENLTKLVRPTETIAVIRMPIEIGGYDGPADQAEGLALFQDNDQNADVAYTVGSPEHDPTLPVALILHRDGSASDYMPLGMKGAPKVRLFGPHATAGAFSTFINFEYWGGIGFQIASGDTIRSDGTPMLGRGVEPDVVLLPRQSDLLAGKDTLHEAALAWVRQELKP